MDNNELLNFQQIVVEEAIIYIEALQKQLLNNLERQEECENLENNKTDDDEPSSL